MKKYLLVIARYQNEKQDLYDKYIEPINKKYCLKHNFEYVCIKNDQQLELVRGNPTWWKFSILQEWIKNNPELFEQEEMDLISIDSNTMIKDTKTMNGTTFNIYLNETVDPRPNPTIMIKPNVYRDNPDYLAWNKLFERTHTPDGKLK